ncbi:hypothetical protein U2W12_16150 [Methylomicrobium sp. Wu6]|nr:hypothetical protein [Methylomicrobium sp. Wu6]
MDLAIGADDLLAKHGILSPAALKDTRVSVENSVFGAVLLDAALRAGRPQAGDIPLETVPANPHEHYYTK